MVKKKTNATLKPLRPGVFEQAASANVSVLEQTVCAGRPVLMRLDRRFGGNTGALHFGNAFKEWYNAYGPAESGKYHEEHIYSTADYIALRNRLVALKDPGLLKNVQVECYGHMSSLYDFDPTLSPEGLKRLYRQLKEEEGCSRQKERVRKYKNSNSEQYNQNADYRAKTQLQTRVKSYMPRFLAFYLTEKSKALPESANILYGTPVEYKDNKFLINDLSVAERWNTRQKAFQEAGFIAFIARPSVLLSDVEKFKGKAKKQEKWLHIHWHNLHHSAQIVLRPELKIIKPDIEAEGASSQAEKKLAKRQFTIADQSVIIERNGQTALNL